MDKDDSIWIEISGQNPIRLNSNLIPPVGSTLWIHNHNSGHRIELAVTGIVFQVSDKDPDSQSRHNLAPTARVVVQTTQSFAGATP